MFIEVFKNLILDSQEKNYRVKERELSLPLNTTKIISLIGSRRSGKTSLFYHTITQLRKKVNPSQIVYINFDDDRLFPLKLENFQDLVTAYYELYPESKKKKVYFFFDEIQNIKDWEIFIRRLHDNEKSQIFITGSSSKFLSTEIATTLRGRTITYELFPLSFSEFLKFNNISENYLLSSGKVKILNYFNKYIKQGGFPELVMNKSNFSDKILQEYIDMIIYKDLIERYKITNHYMIKFLVKYCVSNISSLLSINRLFNILKSEGISVSKNTLYDYLSYLEDAFIIFSVPVHSWSVADRIRNPQKIYSVDIGFKSVMTFERDMGRVFENIVFLELRKRSRDIYYYSNNQEVDFVFFEKKKICLLNVCYSLLNIETKKRELNGLFEAMDFYGVKQGIIITSEEEKTISLKGKTIQIIPLWKWLLKTN